MLSEALFIVATAWVAGWVWTSYQAVMFIRLCVEQDNPALWPITNLRHQVPQVVVRLFVLWPITLRRANRLLQMGRRSGNGHAGSG